MTEYWDIYDENRRKTGKVHERGKPLGKGEYHLVIHVWVQNAKGEFLITKRAEDKHPFPGCWECTGGSALTGETSIEAALRETKEETGIDHADSEKRCVISYRRDDWFGDVWLFRADFPMESVILQTEEATDKRFADKESVLAMKASGEFCNYDYIEEFMRLV